MALKGCLMVEYVENGIIVRDKNDDDDIALFSMVGLTGKESQTIGDIFVDNINHFMEKNDCDMVKITYKIEALQ